MGKPIVLFESLRNGTLTSLNFRDPDNHVENDHSSIGYLAKQKAYQHINILHFSQLQKLGALNTFCRTCNMA